MLGIRSIKTKIAQRLMLVLIWIVYVADLTVLHLKVRGTARTICALALEATGAPSRIVILSEVRSRKAGERESKDLCIFFLRIGKPLSRQVLPCRIHTHNQLHLLDSCPALQLLFASYGCVYIFERLPIHQPVNLVSAGKAFEISCLVLKGALANVVRHANVKVL